MSEQPSTPGLQREISQVGFGAIALNGTIGAGIFALPAIAIARAGAFSPWLYVACGVLSLAIVLVMARVASFFRDTGGPVIYATAAFGSFAGFQAGWLLTLSRAAAFAANAHLMVTYAGWFWTPLGDGVWHSISVAAICVGLTAINVVGIRQGMLALICLTILKLLPLLLLVFFGLSQVRPELFTSATIPAFNSLGETMLIVFYAFVGFESAVIPAGEGKNARRDIPLALVRTIFLITALYFLIQIVTLAALPDAALSKTPLADLAAVLMGVAGAAILTIGAIFSITGNLTASMLSAPRMWFAMGQQGTMPEWFGRVHPRFNTPANALYLYGLFALVLSLSGTFVWLAAMSTVVRLLIYILCIVALPILERRIETHEGQFRLYGGLLVPGAALLVSIWLTTHASAQSWLVTGVFAAIGAIVYALRKQTARPAPP